MHGTMNFEKKKKKLTSIQIVPKMRCSCFICRNPVPPFQFITATLVAAMKFFLKICTTLQWTCDIYFLPMH